MTRLSLSSILSALLVVSHMAIMVWYYHQSPSWQAENPAEASFMFFGLSFMIIGSNFILVSISDHTQIQLELSKMHGVFVLSLGTIYALHYSGLMISNNNEKYFMILTAILIAVIIIIFSAWKHGFFSRKNS